MKSLIVAMGVIIFQMATADRIPYDWANQFGVIDYKIQFCGTGLAIKWLII